MTRDHARIRLDIWTDDEFRDLTSPAQWLYFYLLSAPSLSFAGVADWRPSRIAANARDLRSPDVEQFAAELEDGQFILVDHATEEVLVRSFVKHDGLMRSPNMAVALCKALKAISSPVLRAVAVGQLQRLRDSSPDLKGWARADVTAQLSKRAMSYPQGLETLRLTPTGTPSETPTGTNSNPSGNPSPNPSVTPYSLLPTPDTQHPVVADTSTSGARAGSGLAKVLAIARQEDDA